MITTFEAFAGIGTLHKTVDNIKVDNKIVGISEWFIDALLVYNTLHLGLKPKKEDRKKIIEFLKNYSLSRDSKTPLKSFQ